MSAEYDHHLGGAAELLEHRGDRSAASLLLDVSSLEYQYLDLAWRVVGGSVTDGKVHLVAAELVCSPLVYDRLTPELLETIQEALQDVAIAEQIVVKELRPVIEPASDGWRDRLEERLGLRPTNQARIRPAREDWPRRDGLFFRSDAEVNVYEALKRARADLPESDSILIAPNAGVRVREATWEVDFLVTYRKRAGVIEVDGPHHRGRRAPDRDRERILEDSGIAIVDRFVVEDTDEPETIDRLVKRFLQRLGA